MKTWSWRTFRQVDVVRLVVDCVGADLARDDDSRQLFSRLGKASDDEIMEWSGKYGAAYKKVVELEERGGDDDLKTAVRLRRVGVLGEKAGSYESVDSVEPSSSGIQDVFRILIRFQNSECRRLPAYMVE